MENSGLSLCTAGPRLKYVTAVVHGSTSHGGLHDFNSRVD